MKLARPKWTERFKISMTAISFFAVVTFTTLPLFAGVNPDGSYSHSIPIAMPPGTAGVMPKLSLNYNSNGQNGLLGVGWSLSGLPHITRMNWGNGINYSGSDTYAFSGCGRLVDVSGNKTEYRCAEGDVRARFVPEGTCGDGPAAWRMHDNGGNQMWFSTGDLGNARVDAGTGTATCSKGAKAWLFARMTDSSGNYYNVGYEIVSDVPYPTIIQYTQGNGQSVFRTVEFTYNTGRTDNPAYVMGGVTSTMTQWL